MPIVGRRSDERQVHHEKKRVHRYDDDGHRGNAVTGSPGRGRCARVQARYNQILPEPPSFQSVTQGSATVMFVFRTVAGQTYHLQYDSTLNGTNWNNLGTTILATNTTMTAEDSISSDNQRFYRMVQLP